MRINSKPGRVLQRKCTRIGICSILKYQLLLFDTFIFMKGAKNYGVVHVAKANSEGAGGIHGSQERSRSQGNNSLDTLQIWVLRKSRVKN